ncbi:MAG: LysE family translocator [Candidatus Amulumruptor caecigallinarius]|nr:LysE family translocator [Candidatus Amulumruptor caecigallinarius]
MDFIEGVIYMMWRGIAIGIIISAPMGPVGILCVQRTLEKGRAGGFFTGLGAALSDIFYCLLTGFGLSFIEEFLKTNQNVIQIIGSIVLVVFGVYLFKSNPSRTLKTPESVRVSKRRTILGGFLFTLSNPLIIFLIIGLFARFNFLLPEIRFYHYITGFLFIFIGALLWWWIVTFFVDKVRGHFNLRSMWLINKITGVIILIFAIVGIVTAFFGSASAAPPRELYLNSHRGFAPLVADSVAHGAPLVIENCGNDTIFKFLPLSGAEEFSLSLRAADLETRRKGGWALVLTQSDGDKIEFRFSGKDNRFDEYFADEFVVECLSAGKSLGKVSKGNGFDHDNGYNSFRLSQSASSLVLQGGNRNYVPLMRMKPSVLPDSIGIAVFPGGRIAFDAISLSAEGLPAAHELSHYANPDVLESYMMRSIDPVEGVWEVYDYSLDDDALLPGGRYRMALIGNTGGYDMIYLSGAEKNAMRWVSGMKKGVLKSTPHKNVYDIEWLDPAFHALPGHNVAQYESPGLINISFPFHSSTMRMKKIRGVPRK